MYNLKRDKVGKSASVVTIIAILLVSSIGITNVNALDLSEFGIGNNFGQSVDCVIVVVGCDG